MIGLTFMAITAIIKTDSLCEEVLNMKLQTITDLTFSRYGRVPSGLPTVEIIKMAKSEEMPKDGTVYMRSVQALENTKDFSEICAVYGGSQPLQAGLCFGFNTALNALEYHRSSELLISATDLILMLGDRRDLEEGRYDTQKVEAFHVPAGTAVELYATTLHYAPCQTSDMGFRAIIILPDMTNAPLSEEQIQRVLAKSEDWESRLLCAVNKWLTAHPDSEDVKKNHAFAGLYGKNLTVSDFF